MYLEVRVLLALAHKRVVTEQPNRLSRLGKARDPSVFESLEC